MSCCLAALLVLARRLTGWRCPRTVLLQIAALELAFLVFFGYQHRLHIAAFLGVAVAQEICTAPSGVSAGRP
jgi:hypothetical protein